MEHHCSYCKLSYLGGNMVHLMAVETLFPNSTIHDMQGTSNVNYFAADEGKSSICRVFIEAEMILKKQPLADVFQDRCC